MQEALQVALYLAFGLLVVILAMGVINLVRSDPKQRSRSNNLMRLRVIVQAIAVVILIVLGFTSGMIKLPF